MINYADKFTLLKRNLNQGDIVQSKIIQKISPDKAIADIRGFHVIVKSPTGLLENKTLSFLIAGFNEKDKIVLLKQLTRKEDINVFNKLLNMDSLVKKMLVKNNLPVNELTMKAAQYLYLKDKQISSHAMDYIIRYFRHMPDISFLYRCFQLGIPLENLSTLLNMYKSYINRKSPENEKYLLKPDKKAIIKNLKELVHYPNLMHEFTRTENRQGLLFFLYPLIMNSGREYGFIFKLPLDNDEYPVQLNINMLDDVTFFRLKFDFGRMKINYSYFYFTAEKKTMLIIDTDNPQCREQARESYPALALALSKIIKSNVEIIIKDDILSGKSFNGNLDIYI